MPESPIPGPALLNRPFGRGAAPATTQLENGRNVPSKPDLTVMIGLYRAPTEVHHDLEELRPTATRRGWWSSYRLPGWLHNFVGRSDFAADQYRCLLAMADRPNVTITVLPFAKRLHQSMSGGFTLLNFPDDSSAPVAYSDYAFGGQMEHEPNVVAQLSEVYEELTELALSEQESAEFLGYWLQGEQT